MHLIVQSGPLKGQKIHARPGLTLGRKRANINLKDSKASSIHAKLQKNSEDAWVLLDQGSRNGIKFEGKKQTQILLENGMTFLIGATLISVVDTEVKRAKPKPKPEKKSNKHLQFDVEFEESTLPPIPKELFDTEIDLRPVTQPTKKKKAKPTDSDEFPFLSKVGLSEKDFNDQPSAANKPEDQQPTVAHIQLEALSWRELLIREIKQIKFDAPPIAMQTFKQPVILSVVRGPLAGKTWTLGYGPRKAGPDCADLTLFLKGAPPICFEIIPTNDGALFKTTHEDKVLLNTISVSSEILNVGDVIQIGSTEIEVQ